MVAKAERRHAGERWYGMVRTKGADCACCYKGADARDSIEPIFPRADNDGKLFEAGEPSRRP